MLAVTGGARLSSVLPVVLGFVALSGVAGCRTGSCADVVTERRGVTGTISYQPASTSTPFAMDSASIWSSRSTAIELSVTLKTSPKSQGGESRQVRVLLEGLTLGVNQAVTKVAPGASGATARACLVLQPGASPACLALVGTVDVRRLEKECFTHESGISACADNVDVTLRATTDDLGLKMDVALEVVSVERWADPTCSEEATRY